MSNCIGVLTLAVYALYELRVRIDRVNYGTFLLP